MPAVADGAVHVYHQYTITVPDDRDGFVAALKEEHQIGSGVYYPIPNHRLPSFQREEDLPNTEKAAQRRWCRCRSTRRWTTRTASGSCTR